MVLYFYNRFVIRNLLYVENEMVEFFVLLRFLVKSGLIIVLFFVIGSY